MPEEICNWCEQYHAYDTPCPSPKYFEITTCHAEFPAEKGSVILVTLEPGEQELVELPGGRQALVRRLYLM